MRETKAEIMRNVEGATKTKIIGDNTVEYFTPDGTRVIRFHHTDIVKVAPSGIVTLNSGGWHTPTTKERINGHTDVRIYQNKRVWYVSAQGKDLGIFQDGMTYDPATGEATGTGKVPDKKLIKEIRRYAKAFAAALPVEMPGHGDCLVCQMKDEKTGKYAFGNDHLLEHIKENYFVPSLIADVLTERGCGTSGGQAWFWMAFKGEGGKVQYPLTQHFRQQLSRWIYNYMYTRLIDGKVG